MNLTSFTKIFNLGHKALFKLFDGTVEITEKVDGCVVEGTRILKSNLEYVPSYELEIGDELIGFSDTLNNPKLCRSIVTFAQRATKHCYKIDTDKGPISVTTDHPFLVRDIQRKTKGLSKRWVKADELVRGDQVVWLGKWKTERSWEAGYLAGQFDGEGTAGKYEDTRRLAYYQTHQEFDYITKLLEDRNYTVGISSRSRKEEWKECGCALINGGYIEQLRFIGSIRPKRLLRNAHVLWEDSPMNGLGNAIVKKVTYIGKQYITALSTSTQTYIADGYLSHNSQFGFGKINGEVVARSKGKMLVLDACDSMFVQAAGQVQRIAHLLPNNVAFWGEYLNKPKHNLVAYDRVPKNNIMLFGFADLDWNDPAYDYAYDQLSYWAETFEFDVAPILYQGELIRDIDLIVDHLTQLLSTDSYLGGSKIEGVVIKNWAEHALIGDRYLYPLTGKYVSGHFKERMG